MPHTFCPRCGAQVELGQECSQCSDRIIDIWHMASDEEKAIEPPEYDSDADATEDIGHLWLKRVGFLLKLGLTLVFIALLIAGGLGIFSVINKSVEKPPLFQVTESDGYFHVEYEWNYKWSRWIYECKIPKQTYDYFHMKTRTTSYQEYVLNPSDDEQMKGIADTLVELAEEEGWGEWDTLSFVLSFVQGMPYTSDDITTGYDEYPRYPIETFVDGGGDCEDTSILFASIVREMEYGVVLLYLKEDRHMAAGVSISQSSIDNWDASYALTYYTAPSGKIYAYCETTAGGWGIGEMPDDLVGTAKIIDII